MKTTAEILQEAASARTPAATLTAEQKNGALLAMADALEKDAGDILSANRGDVERAKGHISDVMIDRLALDKKRIAGMAEGIRAIARRQDAGKTGASGRIGNFAGDRSLRHGCDYL